MPFTAIRIATRCYLLVLAGLATIPGNVYSQDTQARVDSVFERWDSRDTPGCAVSVVKTGHVVYAQGYGSANLEYDVPITPSTVFHVASVSKQFTAMAVAQLVADGAVGWDDDIRRYVPEVPNFGTRITLRHLANHTSGLRDQWSLLRMAGWRWGEDVVKMSDVLDVTSRQRALNFTPGAAFLYSNTGYSLLAIVVERVSGKPLTAFAEERIFTPLGMRATRFIDDHTTVVPNRAYAYRAGEDGIYRVNVPAFDMAGSTNLFTTATNLAEWERNFYTKELGGRVVLDDLHRPGMLSDGRRISYGAGLVHGTYRGHTTVGHGGADAGYRSEFLRFPDAQLTVVVLCNEPTSDPDLLVRRVADVYLDGPGGGQDRAETDLPRDDLARLGLSRTRAAPEVNPTVVPLEKFTGFYRRDETDMPLQLVVREGTLTILTGDATGTLVPLGTNRFRLGGSATVGTFATSAEARPTLRLTGPVSGLYRQEPRWRPVAAELQPLTGSYYSAEVGAQYHVALEGTRLVFRERRLGRYELVPTYADGFYASGFYFAFTRGQDGSVDGLSVSTQRAWKVRFDRQ